MENKKDESVPKTPDQISSYISSYFTKEINDRIVSMSAKEMENIMREMIDTQQWIALLKYTRMRTPLLDASLRSVNPIKDPYTVAWSQGALAGLCDIETYIIELNAPKKQDEGSEQSDEA